MMARFRETSDPADQEEIIRSLAHREESEGRKLLLEAALGDGTPEVRMAALEALAEAPREEDLVAVVAALDSPEAGVKDAGIWLLGNLRTEKSLPLWRQVLASPSPDLVMIGFEALAQAPEPLQVEVARSGLSSPQPWIVEHALVVLGGIVSKPAVEALIPAVDHSVSGDLAKDGLLYLLGESFETSAEAGTWWRANESRLDADLQPSETPPRVP
ncbi:MAG: HEAT repeat domain-containing protein [Akkermansiaceae bacterium]|nr:HEAT repeat domain-containing protein [Akkermansiaceae bacterium]MCP5550939.1 HEAT repeat domain-containing protein [Akkermansiaceae bacterium]